MNDFWIQDGERMLFIGDSITDCGRRDRAVPLGDGYVSIFTELATARYPERKIEWTNKGIGGNRTTHLVERWQTGRDRPATGPLVDQDRNKRPE